MTIFEAAKLELEFAERDMVAAEALFDKLNAGISGASVNLHRARQRLNNARHALELGQQQQGR